VECVYTKWVKGQRKLISAKCPVFKCNFEWNAVMVYLYGCNFTLGDQMVVVDGEILKNHPEVFQE
jgi:hypothetical protein